MKSNGGRIERCLAVRELLAGRGDELAVIGLGSPVWDCTAVEDHTLNFPLWGAMGSAAMIGLGLALAQPERRVLVITGDGELLMGLGALPTIAAQKPKNLAIAVLDNEIYGETGGQPTHTSFGVSLSMMAKGAGFSDALTAADDEDLSRAVQMVRFGRGPVLVDIKVTQDASPLVMPPREGTALKNRFRKALLGQDALKE
ncbi:MAG: thiamine pyrophosphate-dependent enzyme [Nitrospinota bacterium]|nr:aldehyde dehydrogenase [Nitrospinota bacterium]MDP6364586.1 thiamine pyrophosphate-dependent enzyme [Nitrospinota bacterium]MDP7169144.1 thiamine pyrophosphate-dependent enzyme [Nitrospinota bacterium]MDP7369423.1 thiamine pyrophosphate-dependent enzyme [Nitrospinota bacterium]MDP7503030.1 thiamine pyrophosphate-dependent enzyme [Nitrospinota bacterium]